MDEFDTIASNVVKEEEFKKYYHLGEKIGEGSFSVVYTATHVPSGRKVDSAQTNDR